VTFVASRRLALASYPAALAFAGVSARRVSRAGAISHGHADRAPTALIRAPTLMVAGGADTVDPVRLSEQSARDLPRTTPHALLVVAGAGHGALIDGCAAARICPLVGRAAAALFITYLARRRGASAPLDPARVHDPRLRLTTVGIP
jgi:pimeloyl-ACP methyl ester carboxylesterase